MVFGWLSPFSRHTPPDTWLAAQGIKGDRQVERSGPLMPGATLLLSGGGWLTKRAQRALPCGSIVQPVDCPATSGADASLAFAHVVAVLGENRHFVPSSPAISSVLMRPFGACLWMGVRARTPVHRQAVRLGSTGEHDARLPRRLVSLSSRRPTLSPSAGSRSHVSPSLSTPRRTAASRSSPPRCPRP